MALISPFHYYKPYPGTPLFDLACQDGYIIPSRLEEWGEYDWTSSVSGRHSHSLTTLLKNMEFTSIFVDRRMTLNTSSRLYRAGARIYRPVARFRFRRSFYRFMPEAKMFHWVTS